jgi:hypothetical protein
MWKTGKRPTFRPVLEVFRGILTQFDEISGDFRFGGNPGIPAFRAGP